LTGVVRTEADRLPLSTLSGANKTRWSKAWHEHRFPYALLAPTAFLLVAFLVVPFVSLFYYGFSETTQSGAAKFVGLANYQFLFVENRFGQNVFNTIVYLFGTLAATIPAAYFAALLVTSGIRASGFLRTALIVPWVLAPVVTALLFRTMLNPNGGPIIELIKLIAGSPIYPTLSPVGSMIVLIVHATWRSFPLMMLMLAAGMTAISNEVYEAASLDGATRWQQFWYVTFPLTRTPLLTSSIITSIFTLHDTEGPFALTRGGPGTSTELVAVRLFKEAFISFNIGQAASVGVVLVGMSVLVIILNVAFAGRNRGNVE
jgi:multiple sugar transport system permease protein